jgi:hypothetical protein
MSGSTFPTIPAPSETPAQPAPRGLRVFAHPVVGLALAGWALNDHVLKDRFHNAVTGKLSDLLAMVVFPLLIAAIAERVVRRPLAVGVGVTAVFFSAINLSHTANDLTERALSLVIPYPQLWPDPTDLVVLPALAVAAWAWHHPAESWSSLRRAWSGVVFAGALATTMATSPPEADRSGTFTGVVVLDAENPVVEIPFELEVDGEPSEEFSFIDAWAQVSALGVGPGDAGPTVARDAVEVTTLEVDGEAVVRYELVELTYAPAEVEWTVGAARDPECGVIRCDSAELALTLEAPADENLPAGILDFTAAEEDAADAGASPLVVERWQIAVTSPDADLRVALPAEVNARRLRLVADNTVLDTRAGQAVAVPLPDDCDQTCEVNLWVSGYDLVGGQRQLTLHDTSDGSDTTTVTVHPMDLVASEVPLAATEAREMERFMSEEFTITVSGLDEASGALANAPGGWPAALSALLVFDLELESDDALTVRQGFGQREATWPYAWIDDCCPDRATVSAHHVDNDKGRGDPITNAVAKVSATVWAPVPVEGITLEVAWA